MGGQCHALFPGMSFGTHCTGGWVGLMAGLNGCGKSRPHRGFDPQDPPARSESLHRLCYASPPINHQQNSIPRPPPCKRCYNGRSMEVRKHVHVMSSTKVLASKRLYTVQNLSYGKTRFQCSLPPRLRQNRQSSPLG